MVRNGEATNIYAEKRLRDDNQRPQSRMTQRKAVTVDEMKVFFALLISIGLTRKSNIADYWSTKEMIQTPFFGGKMAKNRFLLILSSLHLVNNDDAIPVGQPGADRLFKVRPFMQMLKNNFLLYKPNKDLSFDEGLCPFKGRVHFCVYNPMKPHKFGIKLYQVCEASSGYCHDVGFDVYCGKTDSAEYVDALEQDEQTPLYTGLSQTSKIVLGQLAYCGLLSKGHCIYMDNYYTSPELFDVLDSFDTYACGTLRKNRREVPKAFGIAKGLRQGDGIFRRRGNLFALKYHDKRDIHMLSTIHGAKMGVTDRVNRATGEPVQKPVAIIDYVKKNGWC